MSFSSKLAVDRLILVICVLTCVGCGIGWLHASNEGNRFQKLNQGLEAQLSEMKAEVAVRQQQADEQRESREQRVRDLEKRLADTLPGGLDPQVFIRWIEARNAPKVREGN